MALFRWLLRHKIPLLIGGGALFLALAALTLYQGAYTQSLRVSFVYPLVEDGLYPDGQRFMPEDLVDERRAAEALAALREKGWYEDVTAGQILNNLSVSEYRAAPVQEKVEKRRTSGEEYTYYNNEYVITYRQPNPLDLRSPGTLFGLLRPNHSREFLDELYRANARAFLTEHTEGSVFREFSGYLQAEGADYAEAAQAYQQKATLCINYLNKKREEDNRFVSPATGKSFGDLAIAYQSLIDVEAARLLNFATASRLTRDLRELENMYQVDIEEGELLSGKKGDEHEIAQKAMLEYDHTFSENIVIVSVNEEDGLYQARPKTGYDTVTQQALDAGVAGETARNEAQEAEEKLSQYRSAMADEAAAQALAMQADEMERALETRYEELTELATRTIEDYLEEKNRSYMRSEAGAVGGVGLGDAIKWGLGFCLGAALAALFCLFDDWKKARRAGADGRRVA